MPPPATQENTTLVILCGGAARRLGGADKPLQPWRGRPLIEHVLDAIPAPLPVLVSANRNLPAYGRYGAVFTDAEVQLGDAGMPAQGPLVGVYGALERMPTEWLLVTPGDTPLLETGWYERLFAASAEASAVVAHDGKRQQHLHMLLHRRLTGALKTFLTAGRFEVFRFLETVAARVVQFADPGQFRNFNSPEDFATD